MFLLAHSSDLFLTSLVCTAASIVVLEAREAGVPLPLVDNDVRKSDSPVLPPCLKAMLFQVDHDHGCGKYTGSAGGCQSLTCALKNG